MSEEYFEAWGNEWMLAPTGYGDFILRLRTNDGWRYSIHVQDSFFASILYEALQRIKRNPSIVPGITSEQIVPEISQEEINEICRKL